MWIPRPLLQPLARWLFRHTGMRLRTAQWLKPGLKVRGRVYGYETELDSTSLIEAVGILLGEYDPTYEDFCQAFQLLSTVPNPTVVDVGSNVGLTLLTIQKATANQAQVYGFEPTPDLFARCQHNLGLNASLQGRVKIERLALSDHDGELRFQDLGENRSAYEAEESGNVIAPCLRLDSWVEREGLEKLDLLKVDIEGHELAFFEGARKSLERFRPLVYFESLLLDKHPATPELFAWLSSLDYVFVDARFPHVHLLPDGPFPLDTIACPAQLWPQLHRHLSVLGQRRHRQRSRLRVLVDAWRYRS